MRPPRPPRLTGPDRPTRGRPCARRAHRVGLAAACLLLAGCASPAGPVFPPLSTPLDFPPAPDEPRIRYVGSLSGEMDLKPAVSPLAGLGEAIFGKRPVNVMLSPYALCSNGDRLFVCDSNAQTVHVFDLETRAYSQWMPLPAKRADESGVVKGSGFSQPVGIACDGQGRLLVSDSVAGVIFLFDGQGRCLGDIGQGTLKRPCGIAYDATKDRLFVADSGHHQVLVLSLDGTLLAAMGTRGTELGRFNFPTNVAVDREGRIAVSDTLNFRVQLFAPDLTPIRQIGRLGDMPGYFAQPKGLAFDGDGQIYVVDGQFEAVQIFDLEGRLLLSFGDEGSGPGQFWLPAGIFIDPNDRIWIADSYNRRVQVFDYLSPHRTATPAATTDAPPTTLPAAPSPPERVP